MPKEMAPTDDVILGEESHNVHDMSFVICIARSTPILAPDLLSHASGKSNHVEALRVYLLSRSLSRLKNQFQAGKGMITVDCIEGYPPVSLLLGKHVFLSAGDFYLASRS
ncbi:Isoleucine--tRNA ligase cytoplasmic [Zea mays]|nr:Isoleucine--tRNA ligase cytoplasmic [Zea mays]